MTLDLSGLERTAAATGLSGRRARVVPADPRRGAWFRWTADELLVNERIVERLRPDEGAALLVNEIIFRRRRRGLLVATLAASVGGLAMVVAVVVLAPGWWVAAACTWLLLDLMVFGIAWGRVRLAADDDTARRVPDIEVFVRALNVMNQDELHVAGRRLPVRPDLHPRAERLISLHQLRLPADLRRPAGGDAAG